MTRRAARSTLSTSSPSAPPASEGASSSPAEKTSFLTKLYDHLAPAPTTPAERAPRVRAASAPAAYAPSKTASSSLHIPTPPVSAIRWTENGDAIVVGSVEDLKKHTLRPLYGHQNMETFIRQMAIYGHSRSRPVPGELHFRHPEFRRDTPRTDILNVKRKATNKTSRSSSSASSRRSTTTTKAASVSSSKGGLSTTRRIVSDPPSSSPLAPRVPRGIVKRKSKLRGLGPAPAPTMPGVKAEKTTSSSRRSAPRKLETSAPALAQAKRTSPPSSDADDEREAEVEVAPISIAPATPEATKERPSRKIKMSDFLDQTPTKVSFSRPLKVTTDHMALIPFPSMSPVKEPAELVPSSIVMQRAAVKELAVAHLPAALGVDSAVEAESDVDMVVLPEVDGNEQAPATSASDIDMVDTSSVSSLDTPVASPILVPRNSIRAAELESQAVMTPLNVALSRTLDSFAFPAGYPSAALYPTRPRSSPTPIASMSVTGDAEGGAHAPIYRRPSLPSLVSLGLMGRSSAPLTTTTLAMRRARSQSLLASSGPPIEVEPLSRPWSPAFGQWQAPPLSPWSSSASESSLRTPLDVEMSLPVIFESPPPSAPCSASTGLESNVLGIYLGGGSVPQLSTITHSHLSSLASAPRGPRIFATLPSRVQGGRLAVI